jgi:hypothetical protein
MANRGLMPINIKKLASLTAVGAGAMALTSGKAEASPIFYSGVLDRTIGFGANAPQAAFKTFTNIGGPSFSFKTAVSSNNAPRYARTLLATAGAAAGFGFAMTTARDTRFATFSAGAVWAHNFVGGGGTRTFADRAWGSGSTRIFGSPFTDKYLLFQFETNSLLQYGWAEVTLQLVDADSSAAADGPNLTVVSYAYDSSGTLLPAGDTGATPEPSSLAESALAALVLGAEGLRRWRKARGIKGGE